MAVSQLLQLVALSYLIFLALVVGSFINLAADRLPRGESILRPRSHCRSCERPLNTVDLLPVAGYLSRGGRCATCRAPIGVSAPLVELACALLMVIPIVVLGLVPGVLVGLALLALLGVAAVSVSWRRLHA
jgi:leader peptidase (prepilin peptidase)/N-methyltransferase